MGIDPGQLSFGLQTIQAEATEANPTFDTLTVTGETTLGEVVTTALPVADPEVEGQLWADTAVVTVSAGPP